MQKLFRYLMCLYFLVILPSLVFGQTPLVSTQVNEALKRQLNSDGKFTTVEMADGTSFSTAPFVGTTTTTGTGAIVLAVSPTIQTPTISDGAIFNLLSNNNITIDASTNPRTVTTGVVRINHTPGMVGTRPFTLNIDAAGFGDTHAVSTDFTAIGIGAGEQSHLFDINVNTANSTGGEVNGFVMAKSGTGSIDCNAVEVYPGVNVIAQRTGVETAIEQAFSYDGAYTDITSNLSSAASDVQLFVANGDIVYIGNAGTFNSLAVTLAVAASGAGIKPTFEYSAGASAWTAFSPTDGTNGFRNLGGTIAWGTLTGWATDTVNAVGSKYWVRITRTQNTLATPPTEDLIKYIASVNYGWDKDGDISAATLGLGTTTPATALHVVGTVTATGFAGNGSGLTAITATTNANLTGHVTSTGNAAVLGTFTSANLAGALSDETGTGAAVFGTSPTFTTQITTPSIVSAGAVGITPASGSNFNVNLAGTGDLAVNTNQLYVDTSSGKIGIGTTSPGTTLQIQNPDDDSPSLRVGQTLNNAYLDITRAAGGAMRLSAGQETYGMLDFATFPTGVAANTVAMRIHSSGGVVVGNSYIATPPSAGSMLISGSVGIGTITVSNILTLPIASATDPIADAWTVYCLSDYKDIDTSIDAIILSNEAVEKVKISKVSKFTKHASVDRENVEKPMKEDFKNVIKSKIGKDLADYTLATGVEIKSEDYINETLDGLWETKEGKDAIVDAKKVEEEAAKKLLPKFQRVNYGLVAEDAPLEAQVHDANGNLQGVDPYALIGILWAAMQSQERRLILLEGR